MSYITPVEIAYAVCEGLNVSIHDVYGSFRRKPIPDTRAIICYLCRKYTRSSYPEIARMMGRKYHSTIHLAHKKIERKFTNGDSVPVNGRLITAANVGDLIKSLIKERGLAQMKAAAGDFGFVAMGEFTVEKLKHAINEDNHCKKMQGAKTLEQWCLLQGCPLFRTASYAALTGDFSDASETTTKLV